MRQQSHNSSNRLGRDSLSWLHFNLSSHEGIGKEHWQRQKNTALRLVRGLYSKNAVPGMILGDEVGMGKTYEALGVVAALLKHNPKARIVILAHSKDMAKTWLLRWQRFRSTAVEHKYRTQMPIGFKITGAEEMGKQGVLFGSYDSCKRASTDAQQAMLEYLFNGSGIHERTRRRLRFALFNKRRAAGTLESGMTPPSRGECRKLFSRLYDRNMGIWRSERETISELRRLVLRATRSKRRIDLLIIDEAHKMEGGQRALFLSEVLDSRATRALFVTATPFALRVDELLDRIRDMFEATGNDPARICVLQSQLKKFREIVANGEDLDIDFKLKVKCELGKYLVRSSWGDEFNNKTARRKLAAIPHKPHENLKLKDALAVLALETAFLRIADSHARVHRASHRETLCSSYAAIHESIRKKGEAAPLPSYLRGLAEIIPKREESPKYQAALEFLLEKAAGRHKVVVFCKRLATVARLRNDLSRLLKEHRNAAAKLWINKQKSLHRWMGDEMHSRKREIALLRLATYKGLDVQKNNWRKIANTLEQQSLRAADSSDEYDRLLNETWGQRRHEDWVAVLSGQNVESGEKGKSQEAVRFGFNLPGPPYILLCTSVAREGIDLHHWCRRVMHYDLEWNPAWMEQQIGRVDRINSYSWRRQKPVEIYYAHHPGTYEERIAGVVKDRCEMLRVLLGAGQWLVNTPEEHQRILDLERYHLDFSPIP